MLKLTNGKGKGSNNKIIQGGVVKYESSFNFNGFFKPAFFTSLW